MRAFYAETMDTGPLLPRDAYVSLSSFSILLMLFKHGGRTGPLSMKADLEEDPELMDKFDISYLDVVSLYPFTVSAHVGA